MAKLETESASARIANERLKEAIDDTIAGRPTFPSGTAFVHVTPDGSDASVLEYAREGRPVLVVYPDGEERFLVPSPHPRASTGPLARLRLRLRHRFG